MAPVPVYNYTPVYPGKITWDEVRTRLLQLLFFAAVIGLCIWLFGSKRVLDTNVVDSATEVEITFGKDLSIYANDSRTIYLKGHTYVCRKGDEAFEDVLDSLKKFRAKKMRTPDGVPADETGAELYAITIRTPDGPITLRCWDDTLCADGMWYKGFRGDLTDSFFSSFTEKGK